MKWVLSALYVLSVLCSGPIAAEVPPPAKRTTANGKEVPATAQAATFSVASYEAGQSALEGQTGVLDIVKAIRNPPYAAWNVVYYDAAKTTPEELLKRLNENGCPEAKRVAAPPVEKPGWSASVENPTTAAGDLVQVSVKVADGKPAKLQCAPPEGWMPLKEAVKTGATVRLDVQTPAKAKPGPYQITVRAKIGDAAEEELKVDVVLVSKVK